MTSQSTSSASFPDHFSDVASGYASFRPTYPAALFDFLASHAPKRDIAWDCAAGTGQASVALGDRFERVIATDASAQQLREAEPHPHVEYRVASAEHCGLSEHSVSLVTVAQALHWFDVDKFNAEARRVLVPNGLIGVWCYGLLRVPGNSALESAVQILSDDTLGTWWTPERKHIVADYADLPFPFERIPVPDFAMEADWTFETLQGYLRTWSSVSRFRKANNVDPIDTAHDELRAAWGDAPTWHLNWPLTVLAGYANVA